MPNLKDLVVQFLPKIVEFFKKKTAEEVQKPVQPIVVEITSKADIWSNPKNKLTPKFSINEATWLPSWGLNHIPTVEQKAAIIDVATKVTLAIEALEKELDRRLVVSVHVWMRPDLTIAPGSQWDGKDYNRYIYETQVWKDLTPEEKAKKVAPKSPHRTGNAIDFHIVGFEGPEGCAKVRKMLLPHLEEFGLRMEDIEGGWVHLDDMPVVNKRFFRP